MGARKPEIAPEGSGIERKGMGCTGAFEADEHLTLWKRARASLKPYGKMRWQNS